MVLKDHRGAILKMYSGSIQDRTKIENKLWSFVIGPRGAFFEYKNLVILKTDNEEGVKEWENWKWFLDPNHAGLIRQLEQRKKDPSLVLQVRVVSEADNGLARWLAYDGAVNKTRIVLYRRLFGRVKELWMLEMGLDPIHDNFQVLSEEEYDFMKMEADEVQMQEAQIVKISDGESDNDGPGMVNAGVDENMVMDGAEMQGIGERG